jgi:hypothetical protein
MIIQDISSINGLSEFFPSFGIAFSLAAFRYTFCFELSWSAVWVAPQQSCGFKGTSHALKVKLRRVEALALPKTSEKKALRRRGGCNNFRSAGKYIISEAFEIGGLNSKVKTDHTQSE